MVLNETDRALAERLLTQRKAIARKYALAVGAAAGIFALSRIFRIVNGSPSNRVGNFILLIVVAALAVFLVDYFGFRLVRKLKEDLRAGLKHRRTSMLSHLEHHDNAYGETITWIKLEGDPEKLLARGPMFIDFKVGDRATLEFLPRSRLVFNVRKTDA